MLILVRMLMRCLRNSGLDRRHVAEAALAMQNVMSREEEPSSSSLWILSVQHWTHSAQPRWALGSDKSYSL